MTNERSKAIFITGAASGIGRSTALFFLRQGWFVGGADANKEGLTALADELGEGGMVFNLDVSDRGAFGRAADSFGTETGGRMDILFNNAGVGLAGGPFEQTQFADVIRSVEINLLGVMAGIHACAALLKATPNALCFNTCSASAIFGMPNIAVYSATKSAVRALTEALSIEFAAHDIRVADVLPGLVATPLIGARAESDHGGPFRVIKPEAIAETVLEAYGADRLHWYVPGDLQPLAIEAAAEPEKVRDMIANKSGAFEWLNG